MEKELAKEFVSKYRNLFNEDTWFWEQAIEKLLIEHRDMINEEKNEKPKQPLFKEELLKKWNIKKS
jgi:hypothetical protein